MNSLQEWQKLSKEPSRRRFLRDVGTLAIGHSVFASAVMRVSSPLAKKNFVYVGTYTDAVGHGGSGEGIYLYEWNEQTGELFLVKLAVRAASPSCLALHPSLKVLYATNEVANLSGSHGKSGSVSAYEIDPLTGDLKLLSVVSSEGTGPTHLSVDHSGKYVFVANYDGGSVAVLPILPTGGLGPATDFHQDTGSIGPRSATNAPARSFAISGHDSPHVHMVQPSPDNNFVLYTDLGQDRIYVSRFDAHTGRLTPAAKAPYVSLPPGDGPRHFTFHPNGRWLYSTQEEASTVVFFHYDSQTGELTSQQTISALPEGFRGTSFTSEILIAPNGRFLYVANRLHDTIAVFAIDATGRLTSAGESSTLGNYPSGFNLDPSGRFLYSCDLRSDCITCFKIDGKTGTLTFTGSYTGVGSPNSIIFA
jgi:6-phosphogluconolactonase